MKKLGIYFSQEAINIVEADTRKLLNHLKIPLNAGSPETKGQRVNILLQEGLRSHNINTQNATITLASKDLIVRSFDLPILPKADLPAAISSEVTKYIPFKIEEIVYDFNIYLNKKEKRNYVLFAGIKSEELEGRYLSLLSAAGLKPKEVEYAVFSALKLMKLSGIKQKGHYAFIDIDLEDESNITVLEDEFPQFSRTLKVPVEELTSASSNAAIMEKIASEIRISLDFYRRKFPNKEVKKVIFLLKNELRYEAENISKDLGLQPIFVNLPKDLERALAADLALLKAYAATLDIKLPYAIDLISGKEKLKLQQKRQTEEMLAFGKQPIKIKKKIIFLGILAIIVIFAFLQIKKIMPLQREIQQIVRQRLPLATVSTTLSLPELERINKNYYNKVNVLDTLVAKRQYLTPKFDYIPKLIPEGVWLSELNYDEGTKQLSIRGAAYLENSDAEIKAINEFMERLQKNEAFNKTFDEIRMVSVNQDVMGKLPITKFEMQCRKK